MYAASSPRSSDACSQSQNPRTNDNFSSEIRKSERLCAGFFCRDESDLFHAAFYGMDDDMSAIDSGGDRACGKYQYERV